MFGVLNFSKDFLKILTLNSGGKTIYEKILSFKLPSNLFLFHPLEGRPEVVPCDYISSVWVRVIGHGLSVCVLKALLSRTGCPFPNRVTFTLWEVNSCAIHCTRFKRSLQNTTPGASFEYGHHFTANIWPLKPQMFFSSHILLLHMHIYFLPPTDLDCRF